MAGETTRAHGADRRRQAEGLGPVAILVILVLGASLSLVVWQNLAQRGEVEIERGTQGYATVLRDVLQAELDQLDGMVRRRAQIWAASAFSGDAGDWRESATLLFAENPSMLAVMRRDLPTEMVGSAEGQQILREVMPETRRLVANAEGDFLVGPLLAGDGRNILALQVQTVAEAGPTPGGVFAIFDLQRLVEDLFDRRALGFAIRLSAGGREVYRRDWPGDDSEASQHKTESVVLPDGEPWQLEVVPAKPVAPARWDQGPAVALATGLLASALIAAAVHYGTLAWRRDRMLRRVNAALEQQIVDTRRGEGELRELSSALEARVAERTRELNDTIVELETFNYSVSHDLRGQLGSVINFAAILDEDYSERLDATAKDYLRRIVKSATSAVSMMDALLAFSRSGRAEINKVHLDMKRVATEVVEQLTAALPELKCSVTVGDLPSVYADENMMRLVFTNLMSNACKFARPGESAQVEIGGEPGSNEMIYFVRDHGIGFDMRYAEKLFTVFERLHASEGYDGHGVGLAIVARMVRRHGGRYWAESAVGKGATFFFTVATTGAADAGSSG